MGNGISAFVAIEALVLLFTDRIFTPMLSYSPITGLLQYFLQAWIFLKIKDYYTKNTSSVHPVPLSPPSY